MKRIRLGLGLCSLLVAAVIAAQPFCSRDAHAEMQAYEIADRALRSSLIVVAIDRHGEPYSFGTGFVCAPGRVATNAHVVDGAHAVGLVLMDSEQDHMATRLTAIDHARDLAILEVETLRAPVMKIRDTGRLRLGDKVFALGNPMGLEGTFSAGNVSAFRELDGLTYVQITAPISSGSSGGPVLDANCQVVGIATAQYSEGQNLNFAIPATYLQRMLRRHGLDSGEARSFDDERRENGSGGIKSWFERSKQ